MLIIIDKSRHLKGMMLQVDKYGSIRNNSFKSKKLYLSKTLEDKYSKEVLIKTQYDKVQTAKKYFIYGITIELISIIIVAISIFE